MVSLKSLKNWQQSRIHKKNEQAFGLAVSLGCFHATQYAVNFGLTQIQHEENDVLMIGYDAINVKSEEYSNPILYLKEKNKNKDLLNFLEEVFPDNPKPSDKTPINISSDLMSMVKKEKQLALDLGFALKQNNERVVSQLLDDGATFATVKETETVMGVSVDHFQRVSADQLPTFFPSLSQEVLEKTQTRLRENIQSMTYLTSAFTHRNNSP